MINNSELAKKSRKWRFVLIGPDLDGPVLGSVQFWDDLIFGCFWVCWLSFGLVGRGQLLRISGEWTWNIKQILNIDFSIFDSVFEGKKKKIWQVGIPMTSFQEGWASSWSPFASWPWRIESWSLNFQGWNANRYTIISYWFSFICRKVITDAYNMQHILTCHEKRIAIFQKNVL